MWTYVWQVVFGVSAALKPIPDSLHAQASIEELLTYECAKSVALMLEPADQIGPIFSDYDLVFMGFEATDNGRYLLLNAGEGTFSVPLNSAGVNRLRFAIPARASAKPREYFVSFLFDPVTRSRVFDFNMGRAPMGKEDTDYMWVIPRRSEQLLPNLEYNIHETASGILAALTEGHLDRAAVVSQKAYNCEHITRKSPNLGRVLKRSLDVVEQIVIGPKSQPAKVIAASVPTAPRATSRSPASLNAYARK